MKSGKKTTKSGRRTRKGGYFGKILMVDLSNGKIKKADLPGDEVLRKYIGCWGVGLNYLYEMLPGGYKATDSETPMIFMNAPLTGTRLPGATNNTLATKNADTGFTVGRSHTHGAWSPLLKKAGYDGVIITGKSDKPVYLSINEDKAELRDASQIWGKTDTHETEDAIKAELGNPKASVAAIGPAGENVVAGAAIMNDKNHGFCHCGVGTVMGSKKLKAIAVFGTKPVPLADPDKMEKLRGEWLRRIRSDEHVAWRTQRNQWLRRNEYRERLEHAGFCGKNFLVNQLVEFGLGWAKQKFTPRPCPGCPVGCPYDCEITTGPYKGYVASVSGGGEALEGAGSINAVVEPGAIYYLTDLYDRLGLEGSTVGCTIAMAIEAYERGLITKKDTDGLELKWGDDKVVEALAKKIAYKEGSFGELLGRGIREAAEAIGGDAPKFAVHIKGTGMSLHDWRATWGVLFSQIVGSGAGWVAPGADFFSIEHDAGYHERTGHFDRFSKPMEARKTGIVKFLNDCIGLCWFITWGFPGGSLELTAETLQATTGWDYTPEELKEVGERVMHLERAFNIRHGLKPEDDWTVPDRLIDPPLDGPAKGMSIKPYLEGMVKEYYRLMGWDVQTGKPLRATLKRVGLENIIKDMWE